MAGVSVEAALYPLDTIKTQLQAAASTRSLSGLASLKTAYRGIGGNLLGVAPATAVFMAVYEPVKLGLGARLAESQSWLAQTGAAAAAGIASSVIRVPTEVVKQRMQLGLYPTPTKVSSHTGRLGVRAGDLGLGGAPPFRRNVGD